MYYAYNVSKVSIHAPVWGATHLLLFTGNNRFQSTHPCGVRQKTTAIKLQSRSFNPRTRVGCDGCRNQRGVCRMFQSTHPCGVRLDKSIEIVKNQFGFNPRTRVGCDFFVVLVVGSVMAFQSTHPCGVRPKCQAFNTWAIGFNPRTRVGCDSRHGA